MGYEGPVWLTCVLVLTGMGGWFLPFCSDDLASQTLMLGVAYTAVLVH